MICVQINYKDVFFQKFQHNAIFNCRVMSREHASIFYQDGSFFIRDLNSSNGAFSQFCLISRQYKIQIILSCSKQFILL